jgi:hypothetical protein
MYSNIDRRYSRKTILFFVSKEMKCKNKNKNKNKNVRKKGGRERINNKH